jgi:hypothetical protein
VKGFKGRWAANVSGYGEASFLIVAKPVSGMDEKEPPNKFANPLRNK